MNIDDLEHKYTNIMSQTFIDFRQMFRNVTYNVNTFTKEIEFMCSIRNQLTSSFERMRLEMFLVDMYIAVGEFKKAEHANETAMLLARGLNLDYHLTISKLNLYLIDLYRQIKSDSNRIKDLQDKLDSDYSDEYLMTKYYKCLGLAYYNDLNYDKSIMTFTLGLDLTNADIFFEILEYLKHVGYTTVNGMKIPNVYCDSTLRDGYYVPNDVLDRYNKDRSFIIMKIEDFMHSRSNFIIEKRNSDTGLLIISKNGQCILVNPETVSILNDALNKDEFDVICEELIFST